MNKEILIEENKVLKLKNVLMREFSFDDEDSLDKKMHMFESYLKVHNIETFGPLIIKTYIEDDDNSKLIITVIIQTQSNHPKVLVPFKFHKELKVGPCLFARFEGNEQFSSLAQGKMQVYAYENSIVLGSESYSVFKERNENYSIIDTFIPIVGRIKHEGV